MSYNISTAFSRPLAFPKGEGGPRERWMRSSYAGRTLLRQSGTRRSLRPHPSRPSGATPSPPWGRQSLSCGGGSIILCFATSNLPFSRPLAFPVGEGGPRERWMRSSFAGRTLFRQIATRRAPRPHPSRPSGAPPSPPWERQGERRCGDGVTPQSRPAAAPAPLSGAPFGHSATETV